MILFFFCFFFKFKVIRLKHYDLDLPYKSTRAQKLRDEANREAFANEFVKKLNEDMAFRMRRYNERLLRHKLNEKLEKSDHSNLTNRTTELM
mgnify:CR=1 FL=1